MRSGDFLHSSASGIVLAIVSTGYSEIHSPSQCHGHPQLGHQDLDSQFNTLLALILPKSSVLPRLSILLLQLTASPQIGTLPINTKSAPNANALKMSLPLLTPPSNAIGILPLATEAQSRRLSSVAGTPWAEDYG
jgi:hypothetical protein